MQIDSLLNKVRRPSRYIGGEVNSKLKDWDVAQVRWCLAFPDAYEVGMSHIGLEILHNILNSEKEILADRVFAPWLDMESAMREEKVPLWGLSTRRPVKDFDVLGITLPYELTYTNILTILDLAGISLLAAERGEDCPLVIGGGVGAYNPEPVAEFFDAIVLGDGEEAVLKISNIIKKAREGAEPIPYDSVVATLRGRQKILNDLAQIEGVYVPHACHSRENGNLTQSSAGDPHFHGDDIKRAIINNLDDIKYPCQPIVPFMKVIHDRVGVEIQRGCTRGCRFCQAGYIYRPLRRRSAEKILELCNESLVKTGHEDLSFLSLSAGDFEELPNILQTVAETHKDDWINLSLPSLRVETLSPEILKVLSRALHGGFTLAPEAATERLRNVINKGNTEEELLATIEKVFCAGWRQLKLYFMIGLPTETEEDVKAIAELSHKALNIGKKYKRDATITVSVSTFIPKPHTPFQWCPQISIEETIKRQNILKDLTKRRGLELKWHNPEISFLEGVFSRGDRQLSKVILSAWKNGARFDGWDENFKFDVWMKAFDENKIDPSSYLRQRKFDEALPWNHIFTELDSEFLKKEFEKAMAYELTADCYDGKCQQCGLQKEYNCKQNINPPTPPLLKGGKGGLDNTLNKTTLNFTYSKTGIAKWLSHLELMQVFRRAFRRAGLPVKYTEGFHPHMKLSLNHALKVGEESDLENGNVELNGTITPNILETLNKELPDGISFSISKEN